MVVVCLKEKKTHKKRFEFSYTKIGTKMEPPFLLHCSKDALELRGHLQTDLYTLNVIMTFRGGGGVTHVTLVFRNVCTKQLFGEKN